MARTVRAVVAAGLRRQGQHRRQPGRPRLPRHRGPGAHLRRRDRRPAAGTACCVSNGPGDPAVVTYVASTVRRLVELSGRGGPAVFGICLGHQILALALGGRTYKLKFGHRGCNHPVKDLASGRVVITTQNHGYAVDAGSLAGTGLEVTQISLNDGSVEGMRHRDAARLLGAVPPGGIARPSRQPGPVRRVHRRHAADARERLGQCRRSDSSPRPEPTEPMPKRTDIQTILIPGSGPIVVGQAAEFDYAGTQAVKVLRSEGYRVVLVNSNPATIMTDPELADRTYIEPLTPGMLERIIERERPQALLPTVGGQTAPQPGRQPWPNPACSTATAWS